MKTERGVWDARVASVPFPSALSFPHCVVSSPPRIHHDTVCVLASESAPSLEESLGGMGDSGACGATLSLFSMCVCVGGGGSGGVKGRVFVCPFFLCALPPSLRPSLLSLLVVAVPYLSVQRREEDGDTSLPPSLPLCPFQPLPPSLQFSCPRLAEELCLFFVRREVLCACEGRGGSQRTRGEEGHPFLSPSPMTTSVRGCVHCNMSSRGAICATAAPFSAAWCCCAYAFSMVYCLSYSCTGLLSFLL